MTNQFTEKKEIHPGYREIMHQHSIPDSYFWGPIKIYSSSGVNQILILEFQEINKRNGFLLIKGTVSDFLIPYFCYWEAAINLSVVQ